MMALSDTPREKMVRYKWCGFERSSVFVMVEVVRVWLVQRPAKKKLEGSSQVADY
jgi:hypothetical protein